MIVAERSAQQKERRGKKKREEKSYHNHKHDEKRGLSIYSAEGDSEAVKEKK